MNFDKPGRKAGLFGQGKLRSNVMKEVEKLPESRNE